MCDCLRHKYKDLSPEFCSAWEKLEEIQKNKNAELLALKQKNGHIIKAYKVYRAEYQEIMRRWQEIYDPEWEKFDDEFNGKE